MNIIFTSFPKHTQWVEGTARQYKFRAKLYDEGSSYGIDDGRVSVLEIIGNGKKIVDYDRSWYLRPVGTEQERAFKAILGFLEKAPKRFN